MASPFRGVLALVWLFAARAHAQPGELRLEDIIAVAVRQSPDLERARIDVEAARAELLRAEGIKDVRVAAQANGALFRPGPDDPNPSFDTQHLEVSVSRALPTGGTLGVTAAADRSNVTQVLANNMVAATERIAVQLGIRLFQPLLRGAGPTAFEAPIRQAARQRDAAALAREARARDLVVSLATAYWQVAFTRRQLEIRTATLDLSQKQLQYTEAGIRAEKVARSELLAVQQAIAIRRQDVIAGEQEIYERSVALRQLGGLEIGPEALEVKTQVLPDKIQAPALELAAVLRAAFEHSAELASLEAARRAAEIAVAAADNAARSRLDLDVTAGPLGGYRPGGTQVADDEADSTLSGAVNDPGYQVTGTLTFERAIERRGERGGQAAARAALSRAKLDERDGRARLALRATRAVQRANAALARIALGEQAIGLAEQNVTAEQKRFELGKTTNFEVVRRQDELEQARLRHAAAIADYLAVRADLDGLSGAILARYHIVMQ
jgi:outer membrane protein